MLRKRKVNNSTYFSIYDLQSLPKQLQRRLKGEIRERRRKSSPGQGIRDGLYVRVLKATNIEWTLYACDVVQGENTAGVIVAYEDLCSLLMLTLNSFETLQYLKSSKAKLLVFEFINCPWFKSHSYHCAQWKIQEFPRKTISGYNLRIIPREAFVRS